MRYPTAKAVSIGAFFLIALTIQSGAALASPFLHPGRHTLVGELVRINTKAKDLVIRTADGTEHVVAYTGRTAVRGLGRAADASYLAGKEGSQVVIHYTQRGATATADDVDVFGHASLKEVDGTLVAVDKDGRHVVIRTRNGAEETYDLGQDAAIDTKDGMIDAADLAAKKGDRVVIYHTEEGGHKVIHALDDLGRKIY
jgi:hypothetical protein